MTNKKFKVAAMSGNSFSSPIYRTIIHMATGKETWDHDE